MKSGLEAGSDGTVVSEGRREGSSLSRDSRNQDLSADGVPVSLDARFLSSTTCPSPVHHDKLPPAGASCSRRDMDIHEAALHPPRASTAQTILTHQFNSTPSPSNPKQPLHALNQSPPVTDLLPTSPSPSTRPDKDPSLL